MNTDGSIDKDGNLIIRPVIGMDPPFYSTISATIGLFNYRIVESTDPADISDECVTFKYRFFSLQNVNTDVNSINNDNSRNTYNNNEANKKQISSSSSATSTTYSSSSKTSSTSPTGSRMTNDYYYTLITETSQSWIVAQIGSMISLILGGCCVVITFFEIAFGNSKISFAINTLLFLIACAIQGCTFLIWKNSSLWYVLHLFGMGFFGYFCLLCWSLTLWGCPSFSCVNSCKKSTNSSYGDDLQTCELGVAGYASMIACSIYFFCSLLLCCFPRPKPCVGTICCPLLDENLDEIDVDSSYSDEEAGAAGNTATAPPTASNIQPLSGGVRRSVGAFDAGIGSASKGSRSTDSSSPTSSDEGPSFSSGSRGGAPVRGSRR